MTVLAIIPARGGSKGIPRKNIKAFADKPLIAWSIEAAKQSSCISRIVVTTEDAEIAEVAQKYGAEVPFMRPPHLSNDDTLGMAPVMHALEQIKGYEWVMLLQPTSPLRTSQDIDGIWEYCRGSNAPAAVSISEVAQHPYWTYKLNNQDQLQPFCDDAPIVARRQDLPSAYALNGALYMANVKWLIDNGSFINNETIGYRMPAERSVDLDTLDDWLWAEFLVRNNSQHKVNK